jgi:hypothetical protein
LFALFLLPLFKQAFELCMARGTKTQEARQKQSEKQLAVIDWNQVSSYIEAGVSAVTIADKLGIDKTTLYRRCEKDNGVTYATYSRQKKSSGKADLQLAAHRAALSGEYDPKFTGSLIFALKSRLGLSDRPKDEKGSSIVSLTINKGNNDAGNA